MIDGNTAALNEKMHLDDVYDKLVQTHGHAARNLLEDEIDRGGVLIDYVDENEIGRFLDLCYDVFRYGKNYADVQNFEAKKILDDAVEKYMEANFERALQEVQDE